MGQNIYGNQNSSKYKILEELGEGGFGKAYKVQNKKDKKIYVIKTIPIKSKTPEELKSIENEALILKEINNEYIVRYIESFIENGYFNIVMEYCENKDLKTFINTHKDKSELINEEVIYYIALDICYGIKEIHSKNLIHRDLKPENLFISKDYEIKIGDFGISKKLIDKNFTFTNNQRGTFNYMAPEIINGQKYNKKVDIWSLGCILYELFTLDYCFDCTNIFGAMKNITNSNHGEIDTNIYNIEWQNIIDLLLKANSNERPEIDKIINMIKNIKQSFTISNHKDLDNISLNILKKNVEKKEKLKKDEKLKKQSFKVSNNKDLDNISLNKLKKKKEKEGKLKKEGKSKKENFEIITDIEDKEIERKYKIVFVGESAIGAKSSLIRRIMDNTFLKWEPSTVGGSFSSRTIKLKNGKIIRLRFWDTAGQEKYRDLVTFYMKDADCIILGFNVTRKKTLFHIKDFWYPETKDLSSVKLIYLIGNRIDEEREVDKEEAMKFAKENNLRYFETSCKTGEGVEDFFNDLINEVSKI